MTLRIRRVFATLLTVFFVSMTLTSCGDEGGDGGNDGPNTATVDEAVQPVVEQIPALKADSSSADRDLAAVDLGGATTSFVANEITINAEDRSTAQELAEKWNGEIIDEHPGYAEGETSFLLRVDPSGAGTEDFAAAMEQIAPDATIDARVSSEQGLKLLGVAATELNSGAEIGLNVVGESYTFNDRSTQEAKKADGTYRDAFKWDQHDDTDDPKVGTTKAWLALERAGIADPDNPSQQVGVAILDNGFRQTNDFPNGIQTSSPHNKQIGTPSLPGCGGGNPCPWHGLHATSTALAMPDDQFGGAGAAGHLAQGYFYETLNTTWAVKAVVKQTPADVLNMSYGWAMGGAFNAFVKPFRNTLKNKGRNDKLLVAAAGNDDDNLTTKGPEYLPCEIENVLCVGATAAYSTSKASFSNYESQPDKIDIYAMGQNVRIGPDPNSSRNNKTELYSGTSAAAPAVAGIGAMVLAAAPSNIEPGDIRDVLVETAFDPGEKWVHKIVDAQAAVDRFVNAPPKVNIQSPTDGATFEEGETISMEATVDDVDTQSSKYQIVWSTKVDGVDTIFEPVAPGETFELDTLCDGTYDLKAETIQKSGDPDAPKFKGSASVEVTVTDLPPSTAPGNCAPADPQIAIDRPFEGATFNEGESVPLDATINHDSPIYDINWYVDNSLNSPVATGLSGSVTPSIGPHTIIVEYGSDQASVDIEVVDTTNAKPAAGIASPDDGEYFSYDERNENGNFEVSLEGAATDAEDGNLTGSSLVWYTREEGSSDFTQVATGESASIILENLDTTSKDVTIRLVATDSEGRSAQDQVTITLSRLGT